MTKRNHDACTADAALDGLAAWRCVLRNDDDGLAVILRSTGCRRCLMKYTIGCGLSLAAGDDDIHECGCGSQRFTDSYFQGIDAKINAMRHAILDGRTYECGCAVACRGSEDAGSRSEGRTQPAKPRA